MKIIDPTSGLHVDPVAEGGDVNGGLGGAPIALWSATPEPLAAGEVMNLPIKTLQLGFRAAYIIDEIRMVAFTDPVVAAGISNGLTGCIAAKFETGEHAFSGNVSYRDGFSDGFIPIGCYAPRWDTETSEVATVYGGVSGGSDYYRSFGRVRWPLPKPLWLGPGDVIRASVQRHPTLAASGPAISVQVGYIGRVVAPGAAPPPLRQVPWVTYMQKLGTTEVAMSNQEFRNPFTRPLMVQRFTHRLYTYTANTITERSYQTQVPDVSGSLFYESISIEDSLGYQVTRDYVPVGHIFNLYRHAWTFSRPLGPREQFNVKMRRSLNAEVQTYVGMVGYRDEVL